jgi:hypothetical protein
MSGHTPGPWELVPPKPSSEWRDESELDLGGFKAGEEWICTFGDSTNFYPSEGSPPSEANARLIAAAPELLEALEQLSTWVSRAIVPEYGPRKPMPENCRKALEASQSAIAKATGAQP